MIYWWIPFWSLLAILTTLTVYIFVMQKKWAKDAAEILIKTVVEEMQPRISASRINDAIDRIDAETAQSSTSSPQITKPEKLSKIVGGGNNKHEGRPAGGGGLPLDGASGAGRIDGTGLQV